jgi:hypothetical protein
VTEETGRELLPSATGFAAREAIAVLRKRNVPTAPLLSRAGLSEGDIDNRQARISALAQGKLLEYAAEALGDSEFGLHLAEQANPREAGLLFYVASAAEHVEDALALTARYCRIGNEAVRLNVNRSSEYMTVGTTFVGLPRHFAWQNTEFVIAAMIRALREMAGQDFQPVRVTFTLARYSELPEFERFFGCPVEFSASSRSVHPFERDTGPSADYRRSPLAGSASTYLRGGGEGAQDCSRDATLFGRERSAEGAASWEGQQAKSGESAGVERANALRGAGC